MKIKLGGGSVDDSQNKADVEQPAKQLVVKLDVHEIQHDSEELDHHQAEQHRQEERTDVDVADDHFDRGDRGEDEEDGDDGEDEEVFCRKSNNPTLRGGE